MAGKTDNGVRRGSEFELKKGEIMKTLKSIQAASIAASLAFVFFVGSTGCEKQGPTEKMGEEIDEAATNARSAAKRAGEKIGDAAEEAGDQMEDAAD